MLLADFAHWATVRKARRGDDVTIIVDEFSAVSAAASVVIDLAERVRDVGGQVVVSAQSYEGLGGDEDERKRMVGALGAGIILHRCPEPDELLRPASAVSTRLSTLGNCRTVLRAEWAQCVWPMECASKHPMTFARLESVRRGLSPLAGRCGRGLSLLITTPLPSRRCGSSSQPKPCMKRALLGPLPCRRPPEPSQPPPSFLDDLDDGS